MLAVRRGHAVQLHTEDARAMRRAVLAGLALVLGSGIAWLITVQMFEFEWLPHWPTGLGVLTRVLRKLSDASRMTELREHLPKAQWRKMGVRGKSEAFCSPRHHLA